MLQKREVVKIDIANDPVDRRVGVADVSGYLLVYAASLLRQKFFYEMLPKFSFITDVLIKSV